MDKAYRVYVTDCLRLIGENVAPLNRGAYIQTRFSDLMNPKPEETRTPEQIIDHMKDKIAGIGGDGNEFV